MVWRMAVLAFAALVLSPPSAADTRRDSFRCVVKEHDLAVAISACTRLLENAALDPSARAAVYFNRADAYLLQKRFDRAVADLTDSLRLAPDNAEAHLLRGKAHAAAGRHEAALPDFTAAIPQAPEPAAAYFLRGLSLEALGRRDRAIADYKTGYAADPTRFLLRKKLEALGVLPADPPASSR